MLSGKRSATQDFKDWLQRHAEELKGLPPADVAYRALIEGLDLIVVRQWEQHQRFVNMGGRP